MGLCDNFNGSLSAIVVFFMVFLAVACETSEGEPDYMGYEYFPLTEGTYFIYQVDSIVYDDFLGETFHYTYQVKEVHNGFYEDSKGDSVMRLERFIRQSADDPWDTKNVWKAELSPRRAIKTEENIAYVKLVFPVKLNQSWDGNRYNNKDNIAYRITSIHEPWNNDSFATDSALTVLQNDFSTLISEDFYYEVYAVGVGMVKKVYVALSKEIDGTIVRGVDYSYEIIDYGNDYNP